MSILMELQQLSLCFIQKSSGRLLGKHVKILNKVGLEGIFWNLGGSLDKSFSEKYQLSTIVFDKIGYLARPK